MNRFEKNFGFGFACLVITTAAATTGCGLDSVVGGECKSGYAEVGGQCVPSSGSPSGVPGSSSSSSGTVEQQSPTEPGGPTTTTKPTYDPQIDPSTLDPVSPNVPAVVDPPVNPPVVPPTVVDPPVTNPPVVEPEQPLVCEAPLGLCRGQCISFADDPQNCGACGRICASNICSNGVCQGATPGDVVLIGHDVVGHASTAAMQAKILMNAMTIPTADPIRVLSYEAGAKSSATAVARSLVISGAGRKISFTTASEEALDSDSLYASYDVVLVHGAMNVDAVGLGQRWSAPLHKFTESGGVFISLDNGDSDVPAFVNATGMLQVAGHAWFGPSTQFIVTSAQDVVGTQLVSPWASYAGSVGFVGVESESKDVTHVVRVADDDMFPTVVHKIVR